MLKTPLCWISRNEIGNWMDWEHSKRNFNGKKQWKETLPNRCEWLMRSLIWVRSSRRVVKSRQATVRKCERKQTCHSIFLLPFLEEAHRRALGILTVKHHWQLGINRNKANPSPWNTGNTRCDQNTVNV